MSPAIIGFGAIGQALARAFARKNLQVTVASRRAPEAIAPQAKAIGPTVTASVAAGRAQGPDRHLGHPLRVAE